MKIELKILFIVLLFAISLLNGCTENGVNLEPQEPVDNISGLFVLLGPKTVKTYSTWPISSGEESAEEIRNGGHSINIKLLDDETIRIYGLLGADAGKSQEKVFSNCTYTDDCKVFGKKISPQTYEISIENDGRTFNGEMFIQTVDINVKGIYEYQNKTIEYELRGERIFR